jgi:predicted aspartyl protease
LQNFKAFTLTSKAGLLREIISDIGISEPFIISGEVKVDDPRIYYTKALWDTGATNCAITKNAADAIGLKPVSQAYVGHADGRTLKNVYLVNIYLPNRIAFVGVRVTECESVIGNFDVIIGMDIITRGDLSITNKDNKTIVSYRFPSIETIDYVKESNKKIFSKTGRNDPCPCGSGKKYKNCHWNLI